MGRQKFVIECVEDLLCPIRILTYVTQTPTVDPRKCRCNCQQHCIRTGENRCWYVWCALHVRRLTRHMPTSDAHGDLLRGLQVVETSIGITSTLLGDKVEGKLAIFTVKRG